MTPRAFLLIAWGLALLTPLTTSAQPRLAGRASCVAISPDGKLVAGGGNDKFLKVWETISGREVGRYGEHGGVSTVAFSPDGRIVATGTGDGSVHLWDVATRKERVRIAATEHGGVIDLAFSPDGKVLASAGREDLTVALWETATGDKLRDFRGRTVGGNRVAISPDSRVVAVLGSGWPGSEVRIHAIRTGKELARLEGDGQRKTGIVFHPDGRLIVADSPGTSVTGELRVWDWAGTKVVRLITKTPYSSAAIAISADGQRLVSAEWHDQVRVWAFDTGELLGQFRADTPRRVSTGPPQLALSRDGKLVALACGVVNRIYVHDTTTGKDLHAAAAARTDADLTRYWAALGRADPRAAAWAVKGLAGRPDEALPFVYFRLWPAPGFQIEKSIPDLSHAQENWVEGAEESLELAGTAARPVLLNALEANPEPAVRARIERLLSLIPAGIDPTLQRVRAVEVLDRMNVTYSLSSLRSLAMEPTEQPVRKAAIAALRRRGESAPVPFVLPMQKK